MTWQFEGKIDKILSSNIKEIPWEGTEVDKYAIRQEFMEIVNKLLTYPKWREDNFVNTPDGLERREVEIVMDEEDILNEFLNTI